MTDWPGTKMEAWPGQKVESAPQKPEANKLDWGTVAGQAVQNIPASAGRMAMDIGKTALHPYQAVGDINKIVAGAAEKGAQALGVPIPKAIDYTPYSDAVWSDLANRYGGMEAFKKTLAEDPVGVVADLSTVLGGGEAAAARVPGKVARAVEAAARAPRAAVGSAVKAAGDAVPQLIGNIGTGTGAAPIKEAFRSGMAGGKQADAFLDSMRDPEAAQAHVVGQARKALSQIRLQRSGEYQKGMAQVGKRSNVLSFNDIDQAISDANRIKTFKGVSISPSTKAIRDEITRQVNIWKAMPPEFHTPAGMDALKQLIGDIKDSKPFGTPERKVAEEIYGEIRKTIVKQAPEYEAVMGKYEKASTLLTELEKTLSLGKKASEDTALRKLLSTTRSNVNTNFGRREKLAGELNKVDPTLIPSLAGQSMSSFAPQGLVGRGLAGGLGMAGVYGHNPLLALGLPFQSPRLVGEATHGLGRAAGAAKRAIPANIRNKVGTDREALIRALLAQRAAGAATP